MTTIPARPPALARLLDACALIDAETANNGGVGTELGAMRSMLLVYADRLPDDYLERLVSGSSPELLAAMKRPEMEAAAYGAVKTAAEVYGDEIGFLVMFIHNLSLLFAEMNGQGQSSTELLVEAWDTLVALEEGREDG